MDQSSAPTGWLLTRRRLFALFSSLLAWPRALTAQTSSGPTRAAIFIPGTMGSTLSSAGREVWSKDPYLTYRTLVDNPSLLHYRPGANVQASGVLDSFRKLGINLAPLYTSLIELLRGRFKPAELLLFAYDWRQDIRDSVRQLRQDVIRKFGLDVDAAGGVLKHPKYAFDVIGHSQGGLIAFLAVARGVIHPDNIRSVTLLGAPIGGSPKAFRALYQEVDFPALDDALWWYWGRDRALASDHLLSAVRTFPSLYQQLPPSSEKYLRDETSGQWTSPLDQQVIAPDHLKQARELHAEIADAIKQSPVFGGRLRIIHVDNLQTDALYYAVPGAAGYSFAGPPAVRANGDGTVPKQSALYSPAFERLGDSDPQLSIEHSKLCEDAKTRQIIETILG